MTTHPRTRLVALLEQPVRFSVVAALAYVDERSFKSLRQELDITDSALSKHLTALENGGLVRIKKQFVGKTPVTRVCLTAEGLDAWQRHLEALREIAAGPARPMAD